ncbi:MAG: hypothetical protein GXY33_04030 [Phycisphaerae bacterium]|nr:hypothetical protein [Phycisphaerae bacterium]
MKYRLLGNLLLGVSSMLGLAGCTGLGGATSEFQSEMITFLTSVLGSTVVSFLISAIAPAQGQ